MQCCSSVAIHLSMSKFNIMCIFNKVLLTSINLRIYTYFKHCLFSHLNEIYSKNISNYYPLVMIHRIALE